MVTKAKKLKTLEQFPDEIVNALSSDQQKELVRMLEDGDEVTIVNGQLFINKTIESGEIEGWKEGEKVSGKIIDVRESSNYKGNYLATFVTLTGDSLVKPLPTVLHRKLQPYLDKPTSIYNIECLGYVKGQNRRYLDFEVHVAVALF